MPLYVIALPRLAPADAEAIEALRRRWDPQAALLPAHVTLVFARPDDEAATLIERVRSVAAATAAFDLELAGTAVVESGPPPSFYRYLLPRRGGAALQTLHRALNERPFPDFAPHVTLGRFASRGQADAGAAAAERLAMAGRIEALRVERLAGGRLQCLAEFSFAGTTSPHSDPR